MPKRDARYMEEQREMIARAALRCMLEKGVAATSTREVCNYAGISKGALYVHFKTREDIIVAAAEYHGWLRLDPVDSWADYEERILSLTDPVATSETHRQLMAVSYEFLSELVRDDLRLQGVNAQWDAVYLFYRSSLQAMHERGEIALPLGLEPTVRLHIQIQTGAMYCLLSDRRLDYAQLREEMLLSLDHVAGLSKEAKRNRSVKPFVSKPDIDTGERIALTFPYRDITAGGVASNDVGNASEGDGEALKPRRSRRAKITR